MNKFTSLPGTCLVKVPTMWRYDAMRPTGITAFLTTMVILGACGKGEPQKQAADSAATTSTPPAPPSPPAPTPTPVTSAPAASPPSSSAHGAVGLAHTKPSNTPAHDEMKSIGALKYVDLVKGTGAVAKSGTNAMMLYTGRLSNGTVFDSSTDRNQPFVFDLGAGQVIKGWDMGIEGMRVGGKRRLIIPPALGYGSKAVGPIPPNSTLTFDVELVGVNP